VVALPDSAAAVNYAPTFAISDTSITVAENYGPYSASWATNISAGVGDSELVSFSISCSPLADTLFSIAAAISENGNLTFTPAADKAGSSNCTVTLSEAGADGLSLSRSLTIVVTAGGPHSESHMCYVKFNKLITN
jgi:hypothetical protein